MFFHLLSLLKTEIALAVEILFFLEDKDLFIWQA